MLEYSLKHRFDLFGSFVYEIGMVQIQRSMLVSIDKAPSHLQNDLPNASDKPHRKLSQKSRHPSLGPQNAALPQARLAFG